eukprot:1460826-Pleurochrysis_carterae.AAC.2
MVTLRPCRGRPLAQQLPLLLAVCALAHPGCGAVGVTEDDARMRVVTACPGTNVVRVPKSKD